MNKHIVILTPGFPSDEEDENCIPPFQIFLKHFIEKIHEVKFSVITLQYPYRKGIYKWNTIDVYSCGGNNKKYIRRLITWKQSQVYFKEILQKQKIDLIHSFWLSESALLGNHLGKKYCIPHINTMMGQDAKTSNRYLKIIDLNNPKIISLSERHSQIFFESTNRKSDYVIPWGINRDNNNFEEKFIKDIDILGVGSLIELKNYQTFVRIISEVKRNRPAIKCLLIGEGSERKNIERQIEKYNLKDNLYLTGNKQRKEVLKIMQQSKILLHSSTYESLGYVYLEALSKGMYIVSFRTGIASESERWKVVDTESEMIDVLLCLLKEKLDYKKIINFPIEETINQYSKIYGVN